MVRQAMADTRNDCDGLASVQKRIEQLRKILIGAMPPYAPKAGEKLRRLSSIWRQALLHRISDLASAALVMFEQGRLVPGCTLTRSVYETVAQLYLFHKKLAAAVEAKKLADFLEHLDKGAFGSKDGTTDAQAIQVLTAIDHLDKEFTGLRSDYDHLCEYAHPNFKGGLGCYTRFEIPAYNVSFGLNPQSLPMGPFGLGGLDLALQVTSILIERHATAEALLNDLLDREASSFFTD